MDSGASAPTRWLADFPTAPRACALALTLLGAHAGFAQTIREVGAITIQTAGSPAERPVFSPEQLAERLSSFIGRPCEPARLAESLARIYRFLGYVPSIDAIFHPRSGDAAAPVSEPRLGRFLKGALFVVGGTMSGLSGVGNEGALGAGVGLRFFRAPEPARLPARLWLGIWSARRGFPLLLLAGISDLTDRPPSPCMGAGPTKQGRALSWNVALRR
jgi:hypothetical protein